MWKNNRAPVLTTGLLLLFWEILARKIGIDHMLPPPTRVVACLWEIRRTLFLTHLPATLAAVLEGFALSILIGVAVAVLMDRSEILETILYPVLVLTQTIPVMCITPLFVLWFGYSVEARLLAIILSTFFVITVNTFDSLKRTRPEMLELMETYGADRRHIFLYIKAPAALPGVITALKITFPWAVIGAAVAEWLGATRGLGYYSKLMVTRMNGPAVYASVFLLTMIAMAGMGFIRWADTRFVTWRNE